MVLGQVFEHFIEESPVSVMVRGLMEKFLSPQKLDQLFERNSEIQYTKELLFSTVVEMMSAVTCGIRPSIPAADQARAQEVGVSVTSVYNKLNAMESRVSAELVRETAILMVLYRIGCRTIESAVLRRETTEPAADRWSKFWTAML